MNRQQLSLHEVVENAVELAAANASDQVLSLNCHIEPNCKSAYDFDEWCVTQVLTNLLSNALRFADHGAIVVEATCDTAEPGGHFEIAVTDHGPGMSEATRRAAFALPDAREGIPGADEIGFGLMISNQLCELFGATLNIESTLGAGTTVRIDGELGKTAADSREESGVTRAFRNTFALIVDSDVAARRLLEAHLRSWGIIVESVLDIGSALDVVNDPERTDRPLSMLFVTQELPREETTRFLETVRATKGNEQALLVITGSDITSGRFTVSPDPFSDTTLTTPVTSSRLFDCINQHPFVTSSMLPENDSVADTDNDANGVRLLLVEDNIVNQCVATEILKRIGVSVEVAVNGVEALAALDRQTFDFVFMDCQMPEMDGFEATRQIREREALAKLPVVALTANALSGDRQRCLDAGMSDYLTKPFTKDQLEQMLCKWLGNARVTGQPDTPEGNASDADEAPVELLDEAALQQIRMLDPEGESAIFDEIIKEYLNSSEQLMQSTEQAVRNREPDAVARAAHALKSSSAAVGLSVFAEQCSRLDQHGQAGDQQRIDALWPALESTYRKSIAVLANLDKRQVA